LRDSGKLLILLAALTLLRAIWCAQMPMISGEAYYWLWNWHPAAGYFDHPPMVGLLGVPLGGRILGSTLAARFPALLTGFLCSLAFFGLARALWPQGRLALRAAALFSLTPLIDANAMFLSPDNGLALFTTLTWLCFWRAAQRPELLARWMLAGLCAGLALLSKFHAWILLPPLYAFLALSPAHRPQLRRAGPWLAILVALAVLSPNLIWNARHEWLNYAFQWSRSDLPESRFEWSNVLHYLFGPLITLSPLVYAAMLIAIWRGWAAWRATGDARWLYLLCAGVPLPLFLGMLTPMVTISLHWPGPAYGALILLAVALLDQQMLLPARMNARYYRAALWLATAMTALLHLAPALVSALPDSIDYPWDEYVSNTRRLKQKFVGYEEIGEVIRRHRDAMLAEDPSTPVVVMAPNWHLTSSLAFYSKLPREACPLLEEDLHNYRLWVEQRDELRGCSAVVVFDKDDPNQRHSRLRKKYDKFERMLDPLFKSVRRQPSLIAYEDGTIGEYLGIETEPRRLREFLVFRCRGFKGEFIPAE
jgi:hypothetical protein